MKNFKKFSHFFMFELKLFFSRRNVYVIGLFGVALLLFWLAGGEKIWGFGDFRNWLFILAALMQMVYGYNLFHEKHRAPAFLKMLATYTSHRRIFWSMILSRLAIVNLLFLLLLIMIGFFLPNHPLHARDYVYLGQYFLTWILVSMVYFLVGAAVKLLSPRNTSRMILTMVFFILTILPLGLKKSSTTILPATQPGLMSMSMGNSFDYQYWRPKPLETTEFFYWGSFAFLSLGFISTLCFKKFMDTLFPPHEKKSAQVNVNLQFESNEINIIKIEDSSVMDIYFTLLSGKQKYISRIPINGTIQFNQQALDKELDFFYICPPGALPKSITVRGLLYLFMGMLDFPMSFSVPSSLLPLYKSFDKEIGQLTPDLISLLLLSLSGLKKSEVIVFDNTVIESSVKSKEMFLDYMETLKKQGSAVLYITTDSGVYINNDSKNISMPCPHWPNLVRVMSQELSST